jgi:hypothetical protein
MPSEKPTSPISYKTTLVDAFMPPTLSNVNAVDITATTSGIVWETDRPADSLVVYGYENGNNNSSNGLKTELVASLVMDHEVLLTGLKPGKAYTYKVVSKDSFGNQVTSENHWFFTSEASPQTSEQITPVSTPEQPSPGPTRHDAQIPEARGNIHVEALTTWYEASGVHYTIYTKVTIVDEPGSPVPNARVTLSLRLQGGGAVSQSANTNGGGLVTFKFKTRTTGIYAVTIMGVDHNGFTYNPAINDRTRVTITII